MDICSTNGLLPANSNIIDCIKSDKYKKNDLITKPNLISDRFIYLQRIYLFLKHKLTHTVCRTKDYGTKAIFYLQHFHSSQLNDLRFYYSRSLTWHSTSHQPTNHRRRITHIVFLPLRW